MGHSFQSDIRHPCELAALRKERQKKVLDSIRSAASGMGPLPSTYRDEKVTVGSSSVHMVFLYVYNRKPNMELPKRISKTFWSDFLTGGWPCLKLKRGLLCTSTEISDIHATCIALYLLTTILQWFPDSFGHSLLEGMIFIQQSPDCDISKLPQVCSADGCLTYRRKVYWNLTVKIILDKHAYGTYAFVSFFHLLACLQ